MKFQPLEPWIQGNGSITPRNFFNNSNPSCERGSFIGLDVATDLYLANTIDSGTLFDSWIANKNYIERACDIARISIYENSFDLDNEEKLRILGELGQPPECSYNLYFITIYNDYEERLVYIGKTDSKRSRFTNGHSAALKLHNPIYNSYNKRIYFGTVTFLSEENEYLPLEFIQPFIRSKKCLGEMEALLISYFNPELNIKKERTGSMEYMHVHIQNFSGISNFLHDYFI